MVGIYHHKTSNRNYTRIIIEKNGRGKIETYEDSSLIKFTNTNTWYIKKDVLYHGRFPNKDRKFKIDQYKQVTSSSSSFPDNYQYFAFGDVCVVLNGETYVVE